MLVNKKLQQESRQNKVVVLKNTTKEKIKKDSKRKTKKDNIRKV